MRRGQSRIVLGALAVLVVSAVAARADFKDGKRAYDQGDYSTALQELRPLAEQGNAEAQVLVALMYHQGRGVPRDFVQAEKWYKAAADQGNAQAECQLGSMILKKDTVQGLKLLKLSAQQGFTDAYLILGLAYMNMDTKDVPRDLVQADMWLNLAVAHDDPLGPSQRARCERHMTRDQILKARAMATAWKPKTNSGPGENT
ncbi:MAG TPA: tetratricopeptide repeat protein, partial [Terriglobia bacterium]|nr:tetratricopeptide repeat protein [Terriglobia bacterium]